MTVEKVVTASYGNLGRKGTRSDNELVSIDGLILTTPGWTVGKTIANLATESVWQAGIKSGDVMPLVGLDNYENQSTEDTIYDSPLQRRKLTRRGKKRFMFQFDIPLSVHRTLMSDFNNADLRVFLIRDGRVCFYNNGGTPYGFSLSMLNIGMMTEVPADGSTPAFTPIYLDLNDYQEWDKFGEIIEPSWNINSLEPLVDVTLEEVSATATSIVIKAYAEDGYDSDGAAKEVAIKGITAVVAGDNDFVYTASGAGSVSGITDNGDGTYTFAGTGFANGDTITVKTPPNMASDGLLINVTNTVTVAAIV
jgi:hypothetical protein